jgi:hypothetical protein
MPTCTDGLQNQNEAAVDCGGPCAACAQPADGKWVSHPVSFLMKAFADSIELEFDNDDTYSMIFWQGGTARTYSGTCIRIPSGVTDIFALQMDQNQPTTVKNVGMFQLLENNQRMILEIVQTQPALGMSPPVATQGFGSSLFNGSFLGDKNVQDFRLR